jgi:hypothetical protein
MFERLFLAHPHAAHESYFEHLGVALSFGVALLCAAFVCFIHALVPALFEFSASTRIADLHARMIRRRHDAIAQAPAVDYSASALAR